ncbi:hypothetical protein [Zobellia laminariae]|uniref:hypothetical protein n=1 Tax=Zobellia laminariae TaxID=248906 RepID=UPI0026F42BDE|nr:hypothetical protein [Zobellia laminariae]WKX78270.1 hypothetical protein Q5W13_10440 [Zobellia laminariae]
MKNLMFAAVLSLGTMTAFAQEEETVVAEEVVTEVVEAQDAYAEVAVEEVPAAISEALEAAHYRCNYL